MKKKISHEETDTQEKCQVMTEAETRMIQPQATKHQGLTATSRSQERQEESPLGVSDGVWPCGQFDCETQALGYERMNFCYVQPPGWWYVVTAAPGKYCRAHEDEPEPEVIQRDPGVKWNKELHLSAQRPCSESSLSF